MTIIKQRRTEVSKGMKVSSGLAISGERDKLTFLQITKKKKTTEKKQKEKKIFLLFLLMQAMH